MRTNAIWLLLMLSTFSHAQTARVPNSPQPNSAPRNLTSYVSADGRFIVHATAASNLVATDTNSVSDVFLYDVASQAIERISLDPAPPALPIAADIGSAGGGSPMSEDGRYLVYDQGGCIWFDRQTNTRRVIPPANPSGGSVPRYCSISPDGRYVGYITNVQSGVMFQLTCLLYDSTTQTTQIVSRTPAGIRGAGTCREISVSRNGDLVAFTSEAPDLVPTDTNGVADAFLWSRSSNLVTRLSGAAQPNDFSARTDISSDGNLVVFTSRATNLVAGDTNGARDVFLFTRNSASVVRLSPNSCSITSDWPSISDDGRFVSLTNECELAPPNHASRGIYRLDLSGSAIVQMVTPNGTTSPNGSSDYGDVSRHGRVVFISNANNLIVGDTNGHPDVFYSDRNVLATGSPPTLVFNPAPTTTISFAGGTASIQVSPQGGSGGGAAATTELRECAFSGAGLGAFNAPNVSLSFTPGGTIQIASFSCNQAATSQSATLTCNEIRGTQPALQHAWPVVCPINPQQPTNTSFLGTTPSSATQYDPVLVRYSVQGVNGPSGTVSVLVNPGSLSCTATVADGQCHVTPQNSGSHSVTISYAGNATNAPSSASGGFNVAANSAVAPTLTFNPSDESRTYYVRQGVARFEVLPSGGTGVGANSVTTLNCSLSGPNADRFSLAGASQAQFPVGSVRTFFDVACARASTQANAVMVCLGQQGINGPGIAKTFSLACPPLAGYGTELLIGDVLPEQPNLFQSIVVKANLISQPPRGTEPSGTMEISATPGGANCFITREDWGPSVGECVLPPMPAGSYTLNYRYLGDDAFAPNDANRSLNVVRPQPTLTIANASPQGANIGQPVTLRLEIASAYPFEPTGIIDVPAPSSLDTGCQITLPNRECTVRVGRAGSVPYFASYLGDARFAPVNSNVYSVSGFATAQSLVYLDSFQPQLPSAGQGVSVAFRVAGNAPTGSVTITASPGGLGCTGSLSGGLAGCSLLFPTSNTYQITATYAGDANNSGATSGTYSLLVGGGDTSAAPSVGYVPSVGQTINLSNGSAILSASAGGGSGSGAAASTFVNCRTSNGFSPSQFALQVETGRPPRTQSLFCQRGAASYSGTLTCDETAIGQSVQTRIWGLLCPSSNVVATPPSLTYSPTQNGTILLTNGLGLLNVTPVGGSGGGAGANTTLMNCAANSIGVAPTNLTFSPGSGVQSLSLNCIQGVVEYDRTLSCQEVAGSAPAVTRMWTVRCPQTAPASQSANLIAEATISRMNHVTGVPDASEIVYEGDKPTYQLRVRNTGGVSYSGVISLNSPTQLFTGSSHPVNIPAGGFQDVSREFSPEGKVWLQGVAAGSLHLIRATAANSPLIHQLSVRLRPRPVILVNGWASDASTWDNAFSWLRGAGYQLTEIDRQSYNSWIGEPCVRINCTAEQLASAIENVRRNTASAQVDIVAHSRGGLTARSFIGQFMGSVGTGDSRPEVNRFLAFGTPHFGTACADPATGGVFLSALFGNRFLPDPVATAELTLLYSQQVFNRSFPIDQPFQRGVRAVAFAGSIPLACTFGPSDGVVRESSSLQLGGGWQCPLPSITSVNPFGRGMHLNLHKDPLNLAATLIPSLSGSNDSAPHCEATRSSRAASSDLTQFASRGTVETGPGTFAAPINVGGSGDLTFVLSGSVSQVEFMVNGAAIEVAQLDGAVGSVFPGFMGSSVELRGISTIQQSMPYFVQTANYTVPISITESVVGTDLVFTMSSPVSLAFLPDTVVGTITQQHVRPIAFVRQGNVFVARTALASLSSGDYTVSLDFPAGSYSLHWTYRSSHASDTVFSSGFEE